MRIERFGGNASDFLPVSRSGRVNNSKQLLELKALIETQYQDGITAISKVEIDDDGDIVGIFEDKMSDRITKRYIFKITDKQITYKLIPQGEEEPEFSEDDFDWQPTITFLNFGSIIDRVLKWQSLSIGVEFLPGQVRFPGRKHSKKLRSGYGHLRGFVGNDQEALDCYIYPGLLKDEPEGSDRIFQVSQVSPEDGDFDEFKMLIGYTNLKAARGAYLDEMPIDYLGGIQEVTVESLEQYKKSPVKSLSTSRSLPIATNFAEQDKDGADLYAAQLQERSAPIITDWIEQIRSLVQESESFEEVRDRLFDLFPNLNTSDFSELIAQAMMATEALGRFEVLQEAGTLEA